MTYIIGESLELKALAFGVEGFSSSMSSHFRGPLGRSREKRSVSTKTAPQAEFTFSRAFWVGFEKNASFQQKQSKHEFTFSGLLGRSREKRSVSAAKTAPQV